MRFSLPSFIVLATAAASVLGELDYSGRATPGTDLATWASQRLVALTSTKTNAQLASVFDSFFAQNVTIDLDGQITSRADLLSGFEDAMINRTVSKIKFVRSLSVPDNATSPNTAGWAAIFSIGTSIYSTGVKSVETASDHFLIAQDPTVQSGDSRRVTYIQHISFTATTNVSKQ